VIISHVIFNYDLFMEGLKERERERERERYVLENKDL
jgi:hypothetical protein